MAAAASRPRQKGSQQGRWPDGPPKAKPGPVARQPPASLQASSPSATYKRLRQYIAERMRMSHIYQPLMLLELPSRRSPAPAQDVGQRILGSEELNDVESQGLAVANERTAIKS